MGKRSKETDPEKKLEKRLQNAILILALLVFFGAAGYIIWFFWRDREIENRYDELRQNYTEEAGAVSAVDSDGEETDPLLLREIDFDGLQAVNPDVVAWIYIPDTVIDYPVCMGSNDSYYLSHDSNGNYCYSGSIFLYAGTTFDDAAIYFFGHNMRLGHMFGSLKKYKDDDYLQEHPYVYVYTPDANYRATVFSSTEVAANSSVYRVGWEIGSDEYGEWLEKYFPLRSVSSIKEIPKDSQVFFLSTCTGGSHSYRYMVSAVVEKKISAEVLDMLRKFNKKSE